MKRLLGFGLLSGCVALFAAPSSAFESYEHKALGDMAMTLAKYLAPEACKDAACEELLGNGARTYGDIVQCVDDHLTPEKLIALLRAGVRAQAGKLMGIPAAASAYPEPRELRALALSGDADVKSLCMYVKRNVVEQFGHDLLTAQATHNNHAHFQDEALVSLVTYHSLALTVARDQGRLGSALLVNAIADHYLQDLFAPGHIVTPRNLLTDTAATAMHDYNNDEGAVYYVNYYAGKDGPGRRAGETVTAWDSSRDSLPSSRCIWKAAATMERCSTGRCGGARSSRAA